jgi:uncharacterized membrane protein YkgB
MTSAIDTLIGIAIIVAFIVVVGSRIYNHEKDTIDPIIKKIKGWFNKDSEEDGGLGPQDDFEIAFKGQM